jgi:hypothetical protein
MEEGKMMNNKIQKITPIYKLVKLDIETIKRAYEE